jgi:biopolymer transport protein ExbB
MVIFERWLKLRGLQQVQERFRNEASQLILRKDLEPLKRLCSGSSSIPLARLVQTAIERMTSQDEILRQHWRQAVDRHRQVENQRLRGSLWVLGTIGSAAPFIGLAGTVVGILRAFSEIATTGTGGFSVVAAGISEALVATAAGIVIAIVAVMSYNAFQTRVSQMVMTLKLEVEELVEQLGVFESWRSQ